MSYELVLTFDTLPKLYSGKQGSWQASWGETKRWRHRVAEQLNWKRGRPQTPLARATISCVRASSQEPDGENLAWSFKPIIDALVREHVLVDDDPGRLERHYAWVPAAPGHSHIQVSVKEVE